MNTTSSLAALLKSTTYELCRPEGRVVGTPGHATAERYVALSLAEIGCRPYRGTSFSLPYRRDGIRFTNFAGVIPGKDRSLAPLLVGAHYDSVIEAPCADDNGAAVSICLALGRLSKSLAICRTILIPLSASSAIILDGNLFYIPQGLGATKRDWSLSNRIRRLQLGPGTRRLHPSGFQTYPLKSIST